MPSIWARSFAAASLLIAFTVGAQGVPQPIPKPSPPPPPAPPMVPPPPPAPPPSVIADLTACNKPVLLVVWIEALDRSKSGAYGKALRESKLVPSHGGTYQAVSPPAELIEGEWPADRGFVVERYPCRAAFERFWTSDEYQKKVKPLREGSGKYTVALFDERMQALPAPADPMLVDRLTNRPKGAWPMSWFQPRERVVGSAASVAANATATATSVEAAGLATATDYTKAKNGQALMVWRNGKLEHVYLAAGFSATEPFNSYHMHWLPLVLAVGRAVDDKLIRSIDDPVERYVPEWRGDARGKIKVRELLTMAAGLELYKDSSDPAQLATHVFWGGQRERAILAWPAAGAPGEKYEYNYVVPELLGIVLERATGIRYADYLSKNIWQPAGNGVAEVWLDREGGRAYQNAAFFAGSMDWLNLGIALADGGRVNGKQVISPSWLASMVTPSATNKNFGFIALGSPHLRERRLSDRVNYYSLVSEPLARDDVIIIDGYLHRIFAVPSEKLVVLYVGAPGRVASGGPQQDRWDDAKLINPVLSALKPIAKK